jgi:glycosyltransferase involved in cell wall biosynthesis
MENEKAFENLRIAFIHGRPKGHPIHALYAHTLNADFFHEDRIVRWHDDINATKARRYLSWLLNAITFPNRSRYSIFFTECIRIPQWVMKKLGVINRRQKLVVLMADESLFFLKVGRYPKITSWLMRSFLRSTDAVICIGRFQTDLAATVIKGSKSKLYTIFNGVPAKVSEALHDSHYPVDSNQILFIGNATVDWRVWYKGIDVMISAFALAHRENPRLKFVLVGEIESNSITQLLAECSPEVRASIYFPGPQKNIISYLKGSAIYFHCSRGDAFPTTILESMAAGVVPIISDCTGTSEVVETVGKHFIVPLDSRIIADRLLWFFSLPPDEKLKYSQASRNATRDYTEGHAVEHFEKTFRRVVYDLNLQS